MPGGIFCPYKLQEPIHHFRGVLYIYIYFYNNGCKFYENSVYLDQTPHSVESGVGLLCLPAPC